MERFFLRERICRVPSRARDSFLQFDWLFAKKKDLKLILLIFPIERLEQRKGIATFENAQKSMNGNNQPWDLSYILLHSKGFFRGPAT